MTGIWFGFEELSQPVLVHMCLPFIQGDGRAHDSLSQETAQLSQSIVVCQETV